MNYFHTLSCIVLLLTSYEAQGISNETARLCIFADINDETGYTEKTTITSSFLRALIFEDTPLIITLPLIQSAKIRAQRFQNALENVRAGKPITLDEKTKNAWKSYSNAPESDYQKAVAASNIMDSHGKEALKKGADACSYYESFIKKNVPNIPEFIKEQATDDAFAYMSDLSFSRFELFSKAPEYLIAIPKDYLEERRQWLKTRIAAEEITIPEALIDSCAVGINCVHAQKISGLPAHLDSTWKQYTTKTIRELFTFTSDNSRIDLSRFLRMDIFMNGHGSPAATKNQIGFIAGLPDFVVYELMEVLAKRKFVRSVIVQSCYSGGENSTRILERLKSIPGGDSFTLVVSAIADTVTFSQKASPTLFRNPTNCFFAANSVLKVPIDMAPLSRFFNALNDWYSPRLNNEEVFTTELSKLLTVFAIFRKQQHLHKPLATNITFAFKSGTKPLELNELVRRATSPGSIEIVLALPGETYSALIDGPDGLWKKIINSKEPLESVFTGVEKKLETFAPAQKYAPKLSSYSLTQTLEILNGGLSTGAVFAVRPANTGQWFTDQTISEFFTISNSTVRRARMGGGDALTRSYRYSIQYNPQTSFVSVQRDSEIAPHSTQYESGVITIPSKTSLLLLQTADIPVTLAFNQDSLPQIFTTENLPLVVIDTIEIAAHQFTALCKAFCAAIGNQLSSDRTFVITRVRAGTNQYMNVVIRIFGDKTQKSKLEILYTTTDSQKVLSSGVLEGTNKLTTKLTFSEVASSAAYKKILTQAATVFSHHFFPDGALSPQELAEILSHQYADKRITNELTLFGTSLEKLRTTI